MTNKPDFLIIGAMKAGTTSLHDYLGRHPEIHVTTPKELHFFHQDNIEIEGNIDKYLTHFVSEKKIAGSSPQSYTKCHNKYYQNIPEKIHKYFPDIKLVYILRDPIARYKSHLIENYYEEPLHDVEYNIETEHYLKTGLYYFQLQEYLRFFSLDQIHILTLEDLISNKLGALNKLFKFLGVQEVTDAKLFDFISNKKEDKTIPIQIRESYPYRFVKKVLPRLANAIAHNERVRSVYLNKGKNKLLSNLDEESLRLKYKADVDSLRNLTGLKLNNWSV